MGILNEALSRIRGRNPELSPGRAKSARISKVDYLLRLRELFDINTIYYPGCWDDRMLEEVFDPTNVFYVENDWSPRIFKGRPNLVLADMAKSPFPDGVFDALYYQDSHVKMPILRGAIRTVKPGGLIVFSTDDCGWDDEVKLKDFQRERGLSKVELPFKNDFLNTFQKDPSPSELPGV